VFTSATVTALQGAGKPEPEWQLAVCIRGQSTVTFHNSSFTLNKDVTPLAVFDNGTSLLLETCTIHGNAFTTDLGGDGWSGGVASQDARLTVLSSNVTGNTGSGWAAGAIFVRGIAQVSIQDTSFTNNNARQRPAVFAEGNTTTIIQGCQFEGNSASARGGAVFANQQARVQILASKPGVAAVDIATVFCFLCSGGWVLLQQRQPLSL
jgi:predicted outer membrane repeat protein